MITSTANAKIKRIIQMQKKRKARDEEGLFQVEGIRMFREIPPRDLQEIYVSQSFWEKEEGLVRDARAYIDHSLTYLPETDETAVFPAGQRVKHALFGPGTVLDVDMDKGAHVVQFDEMETPRYFNFRIPSSRSSS